MDLCRARTADLPRRDAAGIATSARTETPGTIVSGLWGSTRGKESFRPPRATYLQKGDHHVRPAVTWGPLCWPGNSFLPRRDAAGVATSARAETPETIVPGLCSSAQKMQK